MNKIKHTDGEDFTFLIEKSISTKCLINLFNGAERLTIGDDNNE